MTRRTWIVGVALVAVAGLRPLAQPAPDIASKLDAYVAGLAERQQFSGAVLVARDGKVLLSKGYGMANYEWNIPNTPDTKFRLGSITKQFTATAILQLEEQGLLSTSDPITKHLTSYPRVGDGITIHHLLTHSSGIPSFTDGPDYREHMRIAYTAAQMIDRFKDKPLEFEPGTKYKYDNSGYFLLGAIIEKVSGTSYDSYLKTHIFEPLGMTDSGYDRPQRVLPKRASGYERAANGAMLNTEYLDMGQPFAAGSLFSTVEDLYTWDRALDTEKVLKQSSLEKMFTPRIDVSAQAKYAYGWLIGALNGHRTIAHNGGINGFSTNITRFPDDRAVVIWLRNVLARDNPPLQSELAAILFGEKPPSSR